jgi:hypothetical protein
MVHSSQAKVLGQGEVMNFTVLDAILCVIFLNSHRRVMSLEGVRT